MGSDSNSLASNSLIASLSQYAAFHRDPRNIMTHFIGVPMIFVAVVILLGRPQFSLMGFSCSPAHLISIFAAIYYLRLDLRFGLIMCASLVAAIGLAMWLSKQSTTIWLSAGLGLFIVGWIIQFVGHFYEGKKPAFTEDIVGLLLGPLFVVAEWGFALGFRTEVKQAIEEQVGPVRLNVVVN